VQGDRRQALKYKDILITGGAGFIGSNLSIYLKKTYPNAKIIALDNLKRRGSELNIKRLKDAGIIFLHGDIRNREDLVLQTKIGLLIECSAEPSVLAGAIDNPEYIINTNLIGMVNCLELARKDKADIIFLSTSRVYPYERLNGLKIKEEVARFVWDDRQMCPGFSERGIDINFPLEGPKSLYGATKLSCELLLAEYIANYGIKGIINRCGVIAGPWQFGKIDQGIFSLWMKHHYFKKSLSYIGWGGKGKQVRDLLHIDDLCKLIDLQINNISKGNAKVYNIGGGKDISLSLLETTDLCQKITKNKIAIGSQHQNRPFDIAVYISDNTKVKADYKWQPKKGKEDILEDIYRWLKTIKEEWD
jgi:CDP-paratose 2-epimerase